MFFDGPTSRTQFWEAIPWWWSMPSLVTFGPVVSEEKIFEIVDGQTDGRRTPSGGKSSHGLLGQVSQKTWLPGTNILLHWTLWENAHLDYLLWHDWSKFNQTLQERCMEGPLLKLPKVFRSAKNMVARTEHSLTLDPMEIANFNYLLWND